MWTIWCFVRTQQFADHWAIIHTYYGHIAIEQSGSYSCSRHWVELFKISSFKILEKFIFRKIFSQNDMQPPIWEQPKPIVVPVLPFLGSYFTPNKSAPIMSSGWFQSCTFNALLHLDEHFLGLIYSQVWVLINSSTYFVDRLENVNFLSSVYLLAKVPYVSKQCFVWEPLEVIMRSLKWL